MDEATLPSQYQGSLRVAMTQYGTWKLIAKAKPRYLESDVAVPSLSVLRCWRSFLW